MRHICMGRETDMQNSETVKHGMSKSRDLFRYLQVDNLQITSENCSLHLSDNTV